MTSSDIISSSLRILFFEVSQGGTGAEAWDMRIQSFTIMMHNKDSSLLGYDTTLNGT